MFWSDGGEKHALLGGLVFFFLIFYFAVNSNYFALVVKPDGIWCWRGEKGSLAMAVVGVGAHLEVWWGSAWSQSS